MADQTSIYSGALPYTAPTSTVGVQTNWWYGKGYGVSSVTDVTGRPLLTYQGPYDSKPILLADRVAQKFDFTIKQQIPSGVQTNTRMDSGTASAAKKILGGGSNDELDHKISLELGGANTPANLFIQPGINNGPSASSDELENNLALDVVAGRISLLDAWRTLENQKGFVLVEDLVGTSQTNAAATMKTLAGNLKDYISGKIKLNGGTPSVALKAQMDQLLTQLAANPLDQTVHTALVKTQVQSVASQLGVSTDKAAPVVSSYLNAYAQNKGIDPKEMSNALNIYVQQILTNSGKNPNVFGVPSDIIINIIGIFQTASTGLVVIGLVLAVVGIFIAGPSAILGAISGGLLESIGAIFGISSIVGIGLTSFAVGEALNVAAIGMNMSVKSMYDNRYLLPSQAITSLKDALAIQKGLAAFLPSTQTTKTSPSGSSSGGGGGGSAVSTKVYSGIIAQGVLQNADVFTPQPKQIIENTDDLTQAAHDNLAAYLTALPGKLHYEITIVPRVTLPDGSVAVATRQQIIKGYTAKGKAEYKWVTNKYAKLSIYLLENTGRRVKVDEIVLGATDAVGFQPSPADLQTLATSVGANIATTDINVADVIVNPTGAIVVNAPPVPGTTPAPTTSTPAPTTSTPATASTPVAAATATGPLFPGAIPGKTAQDYQQAMYESVYAVNKNYTLPEAVDLYAIVLQRLPQYGSFEASFRATSGVPFSWGNQTASVATITQTYPRTVTVNVPTLYVRASASSQAALAGSQVLYQGNTFQVANWTTGENVNGENRWWISSKGNYVWVGGTAEKP